jgi:Mrp family chromosome partitioning ATPase
VGTLQSQQAERLFKYFNQAPFDYILFDTPPLLSVDDAQILACSIQAAILVVDPSKTPRKAVLHAKKVLNRTNTTILGVAINKSCWPDSGKYHSYASDLTRTRTAPRSSINADPAAHATLSGSPPSSGEDDTVNLNGGLPYRRSHQKISEYDSHAPQTDQ